jgi:hypothetical protein
VRVIRRPAFQGHAIPTTAGYPRGPFDADVLAPPVIVHEDPVDDMPVGATAQNGYRGVDLFDCTLCGAVVTEDGKAGHRCG